MLYEALRVIEGKKPKYAIAENVKNLVGKKFKDDFDSLLEELDGLGYNSYWQVLNAKDYGIPQNRERVFIVSIRKDIDDGTFEFPKGFDSGLRLKDLLENEVEEKYYINNDRVDKLLEELKDGLPQGVRICAERGRYNEEGKIEQQLETRKDDNTNTITIVQKDNLLLIPNELQFVGGIGEKDWVGDGKRFSRNYPQGNRVYSTDGVACSQTANGGGLGGVTGLYLEKDTLQGGYRESKIQTQYRIRKLTPLECWRLMGFEDDDYWKARQALEETYYNGKDRSNSQMYKIAGNSIVVDVLVYIYRNLFKDYIQMA